MDAQSRREPTLPRLTDQAQVAVSLARSLPAMDPRRGARGPTVAHLVAGLAGETEGVAGIRLRQHAGEVAARIASHPAIGARSLPSLDTVAVALPVQTRPVWTLELLHAAARTGGKDLAHLLAEVGVSLKDVTAQVGQEPDGRGGPPVWMPTPGDLPEQTVGPETFLLGSLLATGYTADADRVIAITRAMGGNSHTLIRWIGPESETVATLVSAPPVDLPQVLRLRAERGGVTDTEDLIVAVTHLSIRAAIS